ncbi:hypothetical protein BJ742DRAFT_288630 [Cladochytrium replicatum]|nr:hypothetical protein BJ742DRAFT_288630 [Cladochytrium replicatum]
MRNLLILIAMLGSPVMLVSMLMSFWILILGIPIIVLRVIASISFALLKSIWVRVVYRYPPAPTSPRSDPCSGNLSGSSIGQTDRNGEDSGASNNAVSLRKPWDRAGTTRTAADRGPSTTTTVVKTISFNRCDEAKGTRSSNHHEYRLLCQKPHVSAPTTQLGPLLGKSISAKTSRPGHA